MIVEEQLLPASVVAHLVGAMLGVGRQWIDFLNDCRQGRTTGVFGERLMPVGGGRGVRGKRGQPQYQRAEVMRFVYAVRAAAGCLRPFKVELERFRFDDTTLALPSWRMRRLERVEG